MKVVLFGSTGPTGLLLAKQALHEGHEVTAFARDPGRMDVVHTRLRVVQGDVLDPASVDRAVAGRDAVLSALGLPAWKPTPVLSLGVRNILDAMERHGARRIVVLSAAGALRERAGFLFGDLGMSFFRSVLPGVYREHRKMLEEIHRRDLDWIVVRAVLLNNRPKKGRYRVAVKVIPRWGFRISRGDVADFMVRQLTSLEFVRKMPSIAY